MEMDSEKALAWIAAKAKFQGQVKKAADELLAAFELISGLRPPPPEIDRRGL